MKQENNWFDRLANKESNHSMFRMFAVALLEVAAVATCARFGLHRTTTAALLSGGITADMHMGWRFLLLSRKGQMLQKENGKLLVVRDALSAAIQARTKSQGPHLGLGN